jgi:hypothetical protein
MSTAIHLATIVATGIRPVRIRERICIRVSQWEAALLVLSQLLSLERVLKSFGFVKRVESIGLEEHSTRIEAIIIEQRFGESWE